MKKISILLLPLLALLFASSCKDESGNEVTIVVEEPMDDEMIAMANCADVHIHADFMATDELHEVKVELHPEGNTSDMILDFEEHTHDKTYTFEQEINLCSYPSGTAFHLYLEAYVNHDGSETVSKEVEFTLQ